MNLHQDNDGFLERAKKENKELQRKLLTQIMKDDEDLGLYNDVRFHVLSEEELNNVRNKEYKKEI